MNRNYILGLLLVLAIALGLRLPQLGTRPMHADESVHAYKFVGLWQGDGYRYDPHEYHGPSLYYATLPVVWLSVAHDSVTLPDSTLRLVPLAFGLGLLLLLPLVADRLGRGATWWAALFFAVSPAFVFYSRYYIHEMLLVFFTLLLFAATARYLRTTHCGWALVAGVAFAGMYTTKETFVFNLAAAAVGLVFTHAWGHWREGALWWPGLRVRRAHVLAAGSLALVISATLFTSFFSNGRGLWDSIQTYQPWLGRAGGLSPHQHPWTFYFERLFWFRLAGGPRFTELMIGLLAAVGFATALRRRTPATLSGGKGTPPAVIEREAADATWVRFLGFYTVVLATIYTALPYKTPWCALGFHAGLILLAGVGAAGVVSAAARRQPVPMLALAILLLVAGAAHLAWQARRATGEWAADRRNPWVYAHTSPDLLRLVAKLHELVAHEPKPLDTVVKVMGRGGDYWPLPWYLRAFHHVGFFPDIPADPWAPILIVTSKFDADLDEKSGKRWLMTGLYEQRPNVFLELYVELELWKRYLASRPPPPEEP